MLPNEYKDLYYPVAQSIQMESGLPANVLWAQSALETGWLDAMVRDDDSGVLSNNFFNIKHHDGDGWNGPIVYHTTREYNSAGQIYYVRAEFRQYPDAISSFRDYEYFILRSQRYRYAVSVADDWRAYLRAIVDAGYATDPHYIDKVTSIILAHIGE